MISKRVCWKIHVKVNVEVWWVGVVEGGDRFLVAEGELIGV